MILDDVYPLPHISELFSCRKCGKRISKATLNCEKCDIQHRGYDEV